MVEQLNRICRRYPITALYVFGSRAAEVPAWVRGEQVSVEHADSDVDVGVQPAFGWRLTALETKLSASKMPNQPFSPILE